MDRTAREVAADVLTRWIIEGMWSNSRLDRAIAAAGLDRRDAAFATHLSGGVLQNVMLLDHHIAAASSIKLRKLENRVLTLLRLGAYQIIFSDNVPSGVAVNETVKQCRGKLSRSRGYVNAVLRRIAAIADPLEIQAGSEIERASVRYSHPVWICEELYDILGEDFLPALSANNTPPPVSVQANTLLCTADELRKSLEADGAEVAENPLLPNALDIKSGGSISGLRAFKDGLFWVMDAAAALAVRSLDIREGDRVLDLCAAPGGKTFMACALSGGRAEITACDISERKLDMLRKSAARMKMDIRTELSDATIVREDFAGRFDKVICDVPCSGLGIIRKKPDIKYRDRDSIAALLELQSAILGNAGRYVKPGGELVYSTCTWRPAENEDVVRKFLAENPEFYTENAAPNDGNALLKDGYITLLPHIHKTDGFFICHMRKKDV